MFSLEMFGANVAEPVVARIEAAEVPVICLPLTRPSFPLSVLASLKGLELAEEPQEGQLSVDILVGLDFYWELMGTGCVRSDGALREKYNRK